jgi:hypothetical protein
MDNDLELLRLVRYALCTVRNTKLPYDGRAITKNLTTYELCSRVEDRIKELEAAKLEQWTNIDTSITSERYVEFLLGPPPGYRRKWGNTIKTNEPPCRKS